MIQGKGIFIWDLMGINRAQGGGYVDIPASDLARILNLAGIRRIDIKVANGTYRMPAPTRAYVAALRAEWSGEIYGWSFMVAGNPGTQGLVLGKAVRDLGLDGGIGDLEGQFEAQPGAMLAATKFAQWYRSATSKPLGLCSWANHWSPTTGTVWHPPKVAIAFMTLADFGMPMCYWPGLGLDTAKYLRGVLINWRRLTSKPIIPAGRTYNGDGGTVTKEAMIAFDRQVRLSGCPGISWWSLKHALQLKWPWELISSMKAF